MLTRNAYYIQYLYTRQWKNYPKKWNSECVCP